ncbi:hypothetical protein SGLAM104S_04044 [Streptomyces glaucescens]
MSTPEEHHPDEALARAARPEIAAARRCRALCRDRCISTAGAPFGGAGMCVFGCEL